MTLLFDLIYFLAMLFVWPLLLIKSWRTGKYRSGWAGRMGRGDDVLPTRAAETKVLLLHCVSVGELLSVQTLLAKLLAADERLHLVISTGTDTGTARATAIYPPDRGDPKHHPRIHLVRYPLDFSGSVKRLLNRVRPDGIVLVELEAWPNFLAMARRRGIPVAIINGRISERSFPRYRIIKPVMSGMLRNVTWIGVQTETYAKRFTALGAAADKVEVIPTLKYDNAPMGDDVAGREALAAAMGLSRTDKLLVAGSTGPGEEEAVLDAYMALRGGFAELRLAVAPRHPEVVPQVAAAIERRGLKAVKRTDRPDGGEIASPLSSDEVFVLNTMGELRKMYALAFGVFVGRSLVKLGGSDMIEVAALGKPCCFGPYTGNFAEVVELLLGENTAVVVRDGNEMRDVLRGWLENPAGAKEMGARAKEVISRQRGSTDKYVSRILGLVPSPTKREERRPSPASNGPPR